MIKIERTSVMNLENAIRGARNPMNLPSVKPTLEEAVRWANEFISEIDNSR